MARNVMLDMKPHTLSLTEAHPHGHSVSVAPPSQGLPEPQSDAPSSQYGNTQPNPSGYGFPNNQFMMAPMSTMPTMALMFFYPSPGNIPDTMYPSMAPHALTVPSMQQPTRTSIVYPEIERWFQYLDGNALHNKDGIQFAPYGTVLKSKGFCCINQLTPKFVSLADLQE
jgi:hypothetical protein